jgi:predicted metalloprotease with PDZ domain
MNRWISTVILAAVACTLAGARTDAAGGFIAATPFATQLQPLTLVLDASQVARGIAYVHETVPVAPGPFTLVYPKWIPGEHGPTGPLNDLAAIRISAAGKPLDWRRDIVDLYAFHVDVPAGTQSIDVDFDVLLNSPDVMSTHSVAVINWNRTLLYQAGVDSRQYFVKPSVVIPAGWDYGTALRGPVRAGDRVDFATVSLEMFVDSPLDMGRYVKKWDLWKEKDGSSYVQLAAFADAPQDLDVPEDMLKAYQHVPDEAFAMYGSRHFLDYHALLALSDDIGFEGIEHHQSSDDRASADFLTNPDQALSGGDLVTHEFSHSWNGKYRRPDDLTTPNFQEVQKTDLLWVYEGMNQYLGDLLSFRSGIRAPKSYPEYLATVYASMDYEVGRTTTSIIDLTTGAPHFYLATGQYGSIRRNGNDFYTEGELIWLDVDTIIRARSHGARSLDTFLHKYTEPSTTGPMVVTYNRAQIEELLNGVEPYDWHAFFDKYVYHLDLHPPTDELERSGWKLVYNDKDNAFDKASSTVGNELDYWYSFGATLSDKGKVEDVREGTPAWKAGLVPGMEVLAVNNQTFSSDVLEDAVKKAQHSTSGITFIAKQTDWFQTLSMDYHDGIRYPHLERIEGTPDMLAQIAAPKAK